MYEDLEDVVKNRLGEMYDPIYQVPRGVLVLRDLSRARARVIYEQFVVRIGRADLAQAIGGVGVGRQLEAPPVPLKEDPICSSSTPKHTRPHTCAQAHTHTHL
jgi:hypothetical protein